QNWSAFYPTADGFAARLRQLRECGWPPYEGRSDDGGTSAGDPWFMFSPHPASVVAAEPARPRRVFDESALVLRAASEIVLPVPAGSTVLVARYGMLPNAWKAALNDGQCSDGVRLEIALRVPGSAERVLWERTLAPHLRALDRGVQ